MANKAAKSTKKFVSKKGTLKSAIVHRKKVPPPGNSAAVCDNMGSHESVQAMISATWAPQVGKIRSQKADKAARSEDKLKQGERLY